ncbi:MAG TPA: YceI family protein [Longimicrobiales bacterium]|nr:YceI family protein [Longimicrobiales bacterium]
MSSNQSTTQAVATTWTIDPTHTLVGFSAKHMMFTTVRGKFNEVKGTIVVDGANPDRSRVEVEIPAASIDTGVEQRDGHLRSADFLDVEHYPLVTFRSRRVEGAAVEAGDRFKVYGDLTIHGTTREVVLEATYEGKGKDPWGGERAGFSATAKIDRRDFGLVWNQALEAGGVLVGNEIRIEIEAQATQAR